MKIEDYPAGQRLGRLVDFAVMAGDGDRRPVWTRGEWWHEQSRAEIVMEQNDSGSTLPDFT
jgi:hypothetical protein